MTLAILALPPAERELTVGLQVYYVCFFHFSLQFS